MGTVCKCFFLTVALLSAKTTHLKNLYRPLIQLQKCLLHTTKKNVKKAYRQLLLQPATRWYPLISPPPGKLFKHRLRSYLHVNAVALRLQWRQRAEVLGFILTHSHTHSRTLSCHFRHRALWSHRREKGRRRKRRAWAVSHHKRLTVVLFSCFLLCYWHPRLIAAASAALLFGYHTPRVRIQRFPPPRPEKCWCHRSRAVKAEFMAQLFPLTCLLFDCTSRRSATSLVDACLQRRWLKYSYSILK